MPKRKRKRNDSNEDMGRVKCGHCNTFLSKRQYHEHKRQFFDSKTGTWKTVQDFVRHDIQGSSSSSSDGMCIHVVAEATSLVLFCLLWLKLFKTSV